MKCIKCVGENLAPDCPKPFDEPCRCTNCFGEHLANYRLCPKFPGNHANKKVKSLAIKQNTQKTSPARKVDNEFSFAKAATGVVAKPTTTTTSAQLKITSAPKTDVISDVDFVNKLFKYEKKFGEKLFSKPTGNAYRNSVTYQRKLIGYL